VATPLLVCHLAKGVREYGGNTMFQLFDSKKHNLKWPEEAYFQINYKGQVLWAFDRKYALKLLSYIESKERKKRIVGYSGKPWNTIISQDWFLRHIPEHFQTAKARPEIVKKLKSILGS